MTLRSREQIVRRLLPPDTSARRLPWTIVALGLASLFTDVASEMLFPLLPVFLTTRKPRLLSLEGPTGVR
jgi:hypothetical protein